MSKFTSALGALILVVVQNPTIGRARQSKGAETFTTYKGLNVLKNKPFSVANPQTAGQRAQRNAMKLMVALYRLLKPFFNVGFKQAVNPLSPYNYFVQQNISTAIDKTDPDAVFIVYEDLKVAKGSLPITNISTAVADQSLDNVVITWSTALSSPDFSNTDKAYAAVYSKASQEWLAVSAGSVNRSVGTLTIAGGGQVLAGDDYQVYLFFLSSVDGSVSDSVDMEVTAIA